jgi:hypothetical protein
MAAKKTGSKAKRTTKSPKAGAPKTAKKRAAKATASE